MSVAVTYKCDRCGHEQETENQMWKVRLAYGYFGYETHFDDKYEKDWCRDCMAEFGLLINMPETRHPIVPPPTLDDFLRELVRDEIKAAG
jgi:hypothetical protein